MATLNFKHVKKRAKKRSEYEVFDVSEWFGEDDNGEPYTVNVYPITVYVKSILTRATNSTVIVESDDDDSNGADGPKIAQRPNFLYDPSSIIAALCARDDKGNLVFGTDADDAITRVHTLPQQYRPCIVFIAGKAVELSGEDEGSGDERVEKAAKN